MKRFTVVAAVVGLIFADPGVRADVGLKNELTQLEEERAKALAAAAEPINARYKLALEQLLRRATQANDLDTATKVQAELKTVQPPAVTHVELHAAIDDTDWTWERSGASPTIHFSKDGTMQHNAFSGTWEAINARVVKIKAPWGEATLTFNNTYTEYRATSGEPAKQGVKGKKK